MSIVMSCMDFESEIKIVNNNNINCVLSFISPEGSSTH